MLPDPRPALLHSFDDLPDPRVSARCAYPLQELLLVALCAVTCGADDWVNVALWGDSKLDWLRRFLPFEAGVASHDTFSRVFAQLDSQRFEACFRTWMTQRCPSLDGQHIAVDGKSVRGSHQNGAGMVHLVSAWHTGTGLTLGQMRTAAKSNEITAIPELLDALDIRGATITMDAMGCQREIVQHIVEREAHYLIGVKNNQPTLAQAVEALFEPALRDPSQTVLEQDLRIDKGHARLERRRCVVHTELSSLGAALLERWPGLKCVAMVESTREIIQGRDKSAPSTEWRYYISIQDAGCGRIQPPDPGALADRKQLPLGAGRELRRGRQSRAHRPRPTEPGTAAAHQPESDQAGQEQGQHPHQAQPRRLERRVHGAVAGLEPEGLGQAEGSHGCAACAATTELVGWVMQSPCLPAQ
ncbi:MAG: hypothetical protein RLZZ584_2546 [Pseudomonadota bacterium]